MRKNPLQLALLTAVIGSVALVGCGKKEDASMPANDPAAAASAPADASAPPPMTGTPPPMTDAANANASVAVSSVTVGKTAAADKSVTPTAMFAPTDEILVSVRTDGAASNANVGAKLTFQDGQVAGEQNQTLNTTGMETTNISFKNANGWPAGKYRAEVMVDGKAAGSPQEFEVK